MLKVCYNVLSVRKEGPIVLMSALQAVKSVMELCSVPSLDLIQVYLLPIVYEISIEKPNSNTKKRGSQVFNHVEKAVKESFMGLGTSFIQICEEIMLIGSIWKTKKTVDGQQLNKNSDFKEYFEKFKKYQLPEAHTSVSKISHFNLNLVNSGRQKYLNSLSNFPKSNQNYSQFFTTKIIQSLQSQTNPLFNIAAKNKSAQISNQLDIRKLLAQGQLTLNYPLLEELLTRLKFTDNFQIKKNYLSLLAEFVKWGHLESIALIGLDENYHKIGSRISEVQGNKGTEQGENIYPQIKGQQDSKRKFYIEYLKNLEVFARCIQDGDVEIQGSQQIVGLYNFLKKNRKFQFPQNLMGKRIETDFVQNLRQNKERNFYVLKRLKEASSLKSEAKSSVIKVQWEQLNENIQQGLQNLIQIPDSPNQISQRMAKLQNFKKDFEQKTANKKALKTNSYTQQIFENGCQLVKNIDKLMPFYKAYKNKTLPLDKFLEEHAKITKQYEESSNPSSIRHSSTEQYNLPNKQQTSIILQKGKKQTNNQSLAKVNQNVHSQISKQLINNNFYIAAGQSIKFGNPQQKKILSKVHQSKVNRDSPTDQITFTLTENPTQSNPAVVSQNKKQLFDISESQMKKSKKSESNLSARSLKERMEERKQKSLLQKSKKQQQQAMFILKSENQYQINKDPVFILQDNKNTKIDRNYESVEYFDYMAPPSLKVQKNNGTFPVSFQENSQNKNQFVQVRPQQKKDNRIVTSAGYNGFKTVPIEPVTTQRKSDENKVFNMYKAQNYMNNPYVDHADHSPQNLENAFKMIQSQVGSNQQSKKSSKIKQNGNHNINLPQTHTLKNNQSFENKSQSKSHQNSHLVFGEMSGLQSHSQNSSQASHSRQIAQTPKIIHSFQYKSEASLVKSSASKQNYVQQQSVDQIKQNELKPLQNSYYSVEQIAKKVKKLSKPGFKDCFQISKQIIPAKGASRITSFDSRVSRKSKNNNILQAHQQYLLSKVHKDSQIKQSRNRKISEYDGNNSRTNFIAYENKRDLSKNSFSSNSSKTSSKLVSFSSSHYSASKSSSSRMKSGQKRKGISIVSASSSQSDLHAVKISLNNMSKYLFQLQDNQLKKACLRSKCLILKNNNVEIGCAFKNALDSVQITMYITPYYQIYDFSYVISHEPEIQVQSYFKGETIISAQKQIKIQISCLLQNVPYFLPILAIKFKSQLKGEQNYAVRIPCSFNRFVNCIPIELATLHKEFQKNQKILVKSEEFKAKTAIVKNKKMDQYFYNFKKTQEHLTDKYSAKCIFKNSIFYLQINLKQNQNIFFRGFSLEKPNYLQFFMETFQKLLQ